MKKLKTPMLFFLLAFAACKKTDDSATSLTTAEAADMVATSLSSNSNGLSTSAIDITANAQAVFDLNIGCGATKTYTATHASAAGATPSFSNTFNYSYTLNCNTNDQPDNVTGSASDKGSFDGPRVSSTNSGSATFKVAGLTPQATVYAINGEYKRTGTFVAKVESKNTSNTTIDLVVTNLIISKSTKLPTSGTATVTVVGSTSKNANINFTGSVTFTGDGKATVTLSGTVYIIDLITGDVTKK